MSLEGEHLGHYRLERLLGSGGMGEVYLAEDDRIGQQVAIKVIRTKASDYPNKKSTNDANRLFEREAKAISRLDHPNILPLYAYGEATLNKQPFTYLVMPYRKEGTLSDWIKRRGKAVLLSPVEVAPLLKQAASALQHAHDRQVIHQDVKPSNFLIRLQANQADCPDLLLADFGIAKLTQATVSASQSVRGTPTFMAPEQWEGHPVPATDQYALAVMVYFLLVGRAPFQGGMAQVMRQHYMTPPPAPSTFNTQLSPAIDHVLLRALSKQPKDRFSSELAFAQAFQDATRYSDEPQATLAISRAEAQNGTNRTLTLSTGQQVSVKVPPGSTDGSKIHIQEQGTAYYQGGPAGPLILKIAILAREQSPVLQHGNEDPTISGTFPTSRTSTSKHINSWPDRSNEPNISEISPVNRAHQSTFVNSSAEKRVYRSTPGNFRADRSVPTKLRRPGSSSPDFIVRSFLAGLTVFVLLGGLLWFALSRATPPPHMVPSHSTIPTPGATLPQVSLPKLTEFATKNTISDPEAIIAGPDGNLWFTEYGTATIGRITTSGNITEFATPTSNSQPNAIIVGPDGNLWFTEFNTSRIGRITPNGVITEFKTPTLNSEPYTIIVGPDGDLWFTEYGTARIGQITTKGSITEFATPSSDSVPNTIIKGPDGNLWFTEFGSSKIGRISTKGAITEFPTPTANSVPSAIIVGPDSNLWFVESNAFKVGRISTNGNITEFKIPTFNSGPNAIIVGPDGNLWFTEFGAARIGRITPNGIVTEFPTPSSNSVPNTIVVGPDGNLWFTEFSAARIGRITPNGIVTEFPTPTSDSKPYTIIARPDGTLWFTEYNAGNIGQVSPGK